jgi:hypothetical protein
MKTLPLLAALAAGTGAHAAAAAEKAIVAPSTDLSLAIVRLDPPSGSTLKVGETIAATIAWRYSKPAIRVPIWLKLELPDAAPDYTYEGDSGDRAPGEGRVQRHVGLGKPGHVETVVLVAKDAGSHEIYRLRVPVDYTFVADATHEALRKDGAGSRITGIALDPPSPARLAPGTRVIVRIAYDARSEHGLRPIARPITRCAMTYNGTFDPVDGRGAIAQHFTVGEPCAVRQLSVELSNEAGTVVDQKLVDVDLRYER